MNIQVKKAIYNRLVKDIIDRISFLPLGVVCWVFVFALAKTAALLPCKQAANKQVDDVFINDASFKKMPTQSWAFSKLAFTGDLHCAFRSRKAGTLHMTLLIG
jgi:hypothetical protein